MVRYIIIIFDFDHYIYRVECVMFEFDILKKEKLINHIILKYYNTLHLFILLVFNENDILKWKNAQYVVVTLI